MILFLISFLLIFTSSYFITSIIAPKEIDKNESRSVFGVLYLFITAYAQIVLTFEVLSLFKAIKEPSVIGLNLLLFAISTFIWVKNGRPIWKLGTKDLRNRVLNSFKLDKSLIWLFVGFCTLILSAVFLNLIFPITNSDAQAYHLARSLFWVLQGSLNHIDVADVRNICLPINSEILYSWVILFLRKDIFFGFFAFIGYFLAVISSYNIMGYLGFCTRKRLWAIFIMSSFASVIVQISGTETDIIIAGLILSSIFLFWNSLKTNEKTPLIMSALTYALAVGTKTTALIAIPGVGLFMLGLCSYYKRFKPLAKFLGFGVIGFIIFSSYNYILNFIEFGNFLGTKSFMVVSKNYYGIKGAVANFVKHMFMFFDFTGFKWSDYIGENIVALRNSLLKLMHLGHIKDGLYTTGYDVQRTLIEPMMGAGILGFLVYLPCLIWSFIKPVFTRKSKKVWFLFAFAALFLINVFTMSYLLVYMAFSIRFFMCFMVISIPIATYSYIKSNENPLKWIIIAFALFYMMGVSTHLWARPVVKSLKLLSKNPSISYIRGIAKCKTFEKDPIYVVSACPMMERVRQVISKDNKILVMVNTSESIYLIKSLELEGYKLDFRTMEDAEKINFNNYNLIITSKRGHQSATNIKDYERRKDEYTIKGYKLIIKKRRDVPCVYLPNANVLDAKKPETKYPYYVRCGFTKEFIQKSRLKIFATVGVVKPWENEDDGIFNFYENLNNPIKWKK